MHSQIPIGNRRCSTESQISKRSVSHRFRWAYLTMQISKPHFFHGFIDPRVTFHLNLISSLLRSDLLAFLSGDWEIVNDKPISHYPRSCRVSRINCGPKMGEPLQWEQCEICIHSGVQRGQRQLSDSKLQEMLGKKSLTNFFQFRLYYRPAQSF